MVLYSRMKQTKLNTEGYSNFVLPNILVGVQVFNVLYKYSLLWLITKVYPRTPTGLS